MADVEKVIRAIYEAKIKMQEFGIDQISMSIEFADLLIELLKDQRGKIEALEDETKAYATYLAKLGYEPVPVRCEDCEHGGADAGVVICTKDGELHEWGWFCGEGEPKKT